MKETSLFLKCTCEAEGIEFRYLPAEENFNADETYVSFWQVGYATAGLWQRLKWMFYILRKGTIYGDQVILNKDRILELREWLNNLPGERKNN